MYVYFPSCNYTRACSEGSKLTKEFLEGKGFRIAGCCRPSHKTLEHGDVAVTICQSCSAIVKENVPDVEEVSIFELLDKDETFNWPDYHGERMTIQDCWRARDKKPLMDAVRSIVRKMNIEVVELEENYEKTEFCGVFRYNEMRPGNIKIAPKYFVDSMKEKLELHTPEEQQQLMEEHAKLYITDKVICYCNSCLRGVKQGGANGFHLMDLIMKAVEF